MGAWLCVTLRPQTAPAETQQAVAEHNVGLLEDKRIEFRIGINLGDNINKRTSAADMAYLLRKTE